MHRPHAVHFWASTFTAPVWLFTDRAPVGHASTHG